MADYNVGKGSHAKTGGGTMPDADDIRLQYRELVGKYTNVLFGVPEYDWFLMNASTLWWTISDVSKYSGYDKPTILQWVNEGQFPETRPIPGGTSRFDIEIARSSLIVHFGRLREEWLQKQRKQA